MELSAHPEEALPAADLLRRLVPDAGHLEHMPTYIDILCGHYCSAVVSSLAAVRADRKYLEREGALNFYSAYRAHDLHFVVYAAMFSGQPRVALAAADELAAQLTPAVLSIESPPMADWQEAFVPLRVHIMIRFGRWSDLIAEPLPADPNLYCTTATTVHYGRAVAYAATGQLAAADAERQAFAEAYERIPASRYLFNNTSRDILAVAVAMMTAKSLTAEYSSTSRTTTWLARCNSTTRCPTTSREAGCSRPATPTVRCCWSRTG